MLLLALLLSIILPLPVADKTQYFINLDFNATLQLINGI